jgi:hypothetical protein
VQVAICLPAQAPITPAEVERCRTAVIEHAAALGYIVTGGAVSSEAARLAAAAGLQCADGARLRRWRRQARAHQRGARGILSRQDQARSA